MPSSVSAKLSAGGSDDIVIELLCLFACLLAYYKASKVSDSKPGLSSIGDDG